jgi:hypothetical protein
MKKFERLLKVKVAKNIILSLQCGLRNRNSILHPTAIYNLTNYLAQKCVLVLNVASAGIHKRCCNHKNQNAFLSRIINKTTRHIKRNKFL